MTVDHPDMHKSLDSRIRSTRASAPESKPLSKQVSRRAKRGRRSAKRARGAQADRGGDRGDGASEEEEEEAQEAPRSQRCVQVASPFINDGFRMLYSLASEFGAVRNITMTGLPDATESWVEYESDAAVGRAGAAGFVEVGAGVVMKCWIARGVLPTLG
jgi:hypothetical protein